MAHFKEIETRIKEVFQLSYFGLLKVTLYLWSEDGTLRLTKSLKVLVF